MRGPALGAEDAALSPRRRSAPTPLPRYELGPALYLGWSASLLSILGGVCLCSNCCCGPREDPTTRVQLPYKASTAVMPPAASDEGDSSFGKYGKNAYV